MYAEESEPTVVFYWSLLNDKDNVTDKIELIEEKFMSNLSTYCDGSPWKIELSIVLASDLPDNDTLKSVLHI